MKIGVIGIGEMGGTLARRWREKGHSVRVANSRGPEAVKPFADDIGAEAAVRDTAWRENYGRQFADRQAYAEVQAAVIAMNRSFNPL